MHRICEGTQHSVSHAQDVSTSSLCHAQHGTRTYRGTQCGLWAVNERKTAALTRIAGLEKCPKSANVASLPVEGTDMSQMGETQSYNMGQIEHCRVAAGRQILHAA